MKGKNKLVPRLLGVTKESILRVDEKTKEVSVWLTLYAPIVFKINFLLKISIDCQEHSLRELIK